MIYTLTLNPAIDYVVKTDKISLGELNRLSNEQIFVGGKGINVSRVLKNLGIESVALGFVAGFTGEKIVNDVESLGINTDFIKIKDGNSRINIKIKADIETELNAKGPKVTEKEKEELFEKLVKLADGDILVMSGNCASGLSNEIYREIMQRLSNKDIKFVVDASGELLKSTYSQKPWLIKPNKQELEQLFDCKIDSKTQIIEYTKKLCSLGVQNVLVSLGQEGAIFANVQEKVYKINAPRGNVLNTVGAGDSMVAGFLAGYKVEQKFESALRLAAAAGSATAFLDDLADGDAIKALEDEIIVEKLG